MLLVVSVHIPYTYVQVNTLIICSLYDIVYYHILYLIYACALYMHKFILLYCVIYTLSYTYTPDIPLI